MRAPSAVLDDLTHQVPKIMEEQDIWEAVDGFRISCRHQQLGGFDGTELKVAHDGLLRQFLSPKYNQRTDEWGGSRETECASLRESLAY